MSRESSASCTMLTGGDVAPNRKDARGMVGRLGPLFQEADLAFLNLEHSLSRGGRLMPGKHPFHRGAPEMVEGLVEAQFDVLTIANNHILDFGDEALFETMALLEENSLPFAGAGKNLSEARKPEVVERNGLKVGILAYSTTLPQGFAAGPKNAGVNPLRARTAYHAAYSGDEYPGRPLDIVTWAAQEDLRRMKGDIRRLKKKADVILVYQHWGTSMTHRVHDFQCEIGHAAIDAGADAVFGGHQHVLSAIEYYRGKPIVHCTGNLVFDIVEPFFTEATLQTFLFGCTLTKGGVREPYILPCRCGVDGPPVLLSPHRGAGREIIQMMERLCEEFGTRLEPKGDRVLLIPPEG